MRVGKCSVEGSLGGVVAFLVARRRFHEGGTPKCFRAGCRRDGRFRAAASSARGRIAVPALGGDTPRPGRLGSLSEKTSRPIRHLDGPRPPLPERRPNPAMPVTTTASYSGKLSCAAQHPDSGAEMTTAAPLDNNGDGSSFSPTDLVGVALGTCVLTTMAIVAERHGIDLAGATVATDKHMSEDRPRRIARLACRFDLPAGITGEQLDRLRAAAEGCPVKRSLHPDLAVEMTWTVGGVGTT